MESQTRASEADIQEELRKDIVACLHAAYDASTKLNNHSDISPKNRENVSQGIYLMCENIKELLNIKEVEG